MFNDKFYKKKELPKNIFQNSKYLLNQSNENIPEIYYVSKTKTITKPNGLQEIKKKTYDKKNNKTFYYNTKKEGNNFITYQSELDSNGNIIELNPFYSMKEEEKLNFENEWNQKYFINQKELL